MESLKCFLPCPWILNPKHWSMTPANWSKYANDQISAKFWNLTRRVANHQEDRGECFAPLLLRSCAPKTMKIWPKVLQRSTETCNMRVFWIPGKTPNFEVVQIKSLSICMIDSINGKFEMFSNMSVNIESKTLIYDSRELMKICKWLLAIS